MKKKDTKGKNNVKDSKNHYLIDSENINEDWIIIAQNIKGNDRIVVFYTDKSCQLHCKNVAMLFEKCEGKISWIRCCTGKDALDFQLVSRLGYMISNNKNDSFVIVSNDTGYDPVIKHWQAEGCKISRMKREELKALSTEKMDDKEALKHIKLGKEKNLNKDKKLKSEESVKKVNTKNKSSERNSIKNNKNTEALNKDIDKNEVKINISEKITSNLPMKAINTAYKCFNDDVKTNLYDIMLCTYGQGKTEKYYSDYIRYRGQLEKLSENYIKDRNIRMKEYFNFALSAEGENLSASGRLTHWFMKAPKETLNALYHNALKEFGQADGQKYYRVIKKHLTPLKKL